jgi:hypothetical protein
VNYSDMRTNLLPLGFAAVFGLVFYALGFGPLLSMISAIIGAISGRAWLGRLDSQQGSTPRDLLQRALRGERISKDQLRASIASPDAREPSASLVAGFGAILIRGSFCQRIAARIFIAQIMSGVIAIPLFFVSQTMGLNVAFFDDPYLTHLLSTNFPIDASSTIAKVRFDSLFVPLFLIYGLSLPMLFAAFLSCLDVTLRNIRKHWRILIAVPMFIGTPALMVFHKSTSLFGWERLIVVGNMWGYLEIFVLFPLCLLFVTASLPYVRSR